MTRASRAWGTMSLLMAVLAAGGRVAAADGGSIGGTIVDAFGAAVGAAPVALLHDGQAVKQTTSDGKGEFVFQAVPSGRYQVEVNAAGFSKQTSAPVFVAASGRSVVDVALAIGAL